MTTAGGEDGQFREWALGVIIGHQVKVLAAKPDDLSPIPRTHLVDGENLCKLVSDLQMHVVPHIDTEIKVV